jgi:hypothetical protein
MTNCTERVSLPTWGSATQKTLDNYVDSKLNPCLNAVNGGWLITSKRMLLEDIYQSNVRDR